MPNSQRDQALRFHSLHDSGTPLVLPNAWDVASARLAEDGGAKAIATTSAGVAWSLGAADGDQLDRDRALDLIARLVDAVGVPVTADIESGYADSADGVADTVTRVLDAGAVGINIEDTQHSGPSPLRPVDEQRQWITAARKAADAKDIPLFVNARIDTFLHAVGARETRLPDVIDRATAYVEAGADGIFVPGVVDPTTVAALVEAVTVPLNIMVGPGAPTVQELAGLGVARVSVGSGIAQAAYELVRRSTAELLSTGTYTALSEAVDYGTLNNLFRAGR